MNTEPIPQEPTPAYTDAPVVKNTLVYPLSFTGQGDEYFKIWIVNLLLILVTCGIYYPWAKLRKQKYLHRNLILDGAAFDYHAQPKALFIGMVVALVLSGAYFLMAHLDSVVALLGITAVLSALVPWLIWKAFRFRLAVTTYRALPFKFVGSLKDAYIMIVPQFVMLAVLDFAMMNVREDLEAKIPPNMKLFIAFYIVVLFLAPALHLFLKRYQHNNYQWTSLRTQLSTTYKNIYLEYLKYLGIVLGASVLFGILVAIVIGIAGVAGIAFGRGGMSVLSFVFVFLMFVSVFLGYAAMFALFSSQFTARFQNLIWNHTTAHGITIQSELNPWGLFWLYFKNSFFILITLGFYWPFAAMKVAKFRAASISIHAQAPLMMLAAAMLGEAREQNAVGDAVGDVFGVDIGM
jgi:uncharacterized membrane protein YjgN (DUF898 family)